MGQVGSEAAMLFGGGSTVLRGKEAYVASARVRSGVAKAEQGD